MKKIIKEKIMRKLRTKGLGCPYLKSQLSAQHKRREKSHSEGHDCEISDPWGQGDHPKNIWREAFIGSIERMEE